MFNFNKVKAGIILASLLLAGSTSCALEKNQAAAAQEEKAQISALLNGALNKQRIYVTAPGFPSKLHEMALVAEDPDAEENKSKQYHPAEKAGWLSMIAYGEALEKAGALKITHGSFFDDDFYNRRFKFTGVLMEFTGDMKDYVAVTSQDGRVLLRVGVAGVGEISSLKKLSDTSYEVSFTTALANRSPWFTDEVELHTKISSLLGGLEKCTLALKNGTYVIDDEAFLNTLKKPVVDFKN